ncbi:NADP-dependent oxidoreductase [Chitinasiproducens palmae]|uniref:NADPH:quinone reductase n=1 Tax=Chitinasiproducens palmae TaxID=1770053 RepID=A0A1H2PQN6_9BURK|nr:NADP-dependent oxidoreductase [Chitinasiproducens palmae]SDV48319.1 NADPH:quinone reductase [Chitinasiproducens palmae]
MSLMTAYRVTRFGGPDNLHPDDIEIPSPGPGEFLIRTRGASVNPVDFKIREGKYPPIGADRLPFTLGRDLAGEIVSAGDGATGFVPGDAVFGFVGHAQGTFADYVTLAAEALAPRPALLDFTQAGAVPLAALTAWQGLFEYGGLLAGQRVLIHAGAGGVGHFAVQFAKARGAEVFATGSGDGLALIDSLGADHVIDYRRQRFEEVARDIDVVFDLLAGETQARSWQVLREGGALISTLQAPSPEVAQAHRARAARFTARPDGAQLREIASLIDAQRVRVYLDETFGKSGVKAALARVEDGHVHGKVAVAWSEGS